MRGKRMDRGERENPTKTKQMIFFCFLCSTVLNYVITFSLCICVLGKKIVYTRVEWSERAEKKKFLEKKSTPIERIYRERVRGGKKRNENNAIIKAHGFVYHSHSLYKIECI
jgi:hypothetical protein